jgi:hypothetical protein
MEAITRADAISAMETARRLKTSIAKQRQTAEEGISAAFTTGTVLVVGGGMAWLNERFGDSNADLGGSMREVLIPGTKAPVDIVGGLGVHALTFFLGSSFKYAEFGHNVGAALIGGWGIRNAMAMGAEARASADGKTGSSGTPGRTGVGWTPRTGTRTG